MLPPKALSISIMLSPSLPLAVLVMAARELGAVGR